MKLTGFNFGIWSDAELLLKLTFFMSEISSNPGFLLLKVTGFKVVCGRSNVLLLLKLTGFKIGVRSDLGLFGKVNCLWFGDCSDVGLLLKLNGFTSCTSDDGLLL